MSIMSDSPSAPYSVFSTPETKHAATLVNTNVVLQKVLHTISSGDRKHMILRCEELPFVLVPEGDIEIIFTGLLQLILQKRDEVATLFLHISPVPPNIKSGTGKKSKKVVIRFTTNLTPRSNWRQMHEEQLQTIVAIAQKNKGSLTADSVTTGCCIFSVSLPGKTL